MKIKQMPSPNFYAGRKGYRPELIIVHIMDGTLSGTDSWFSTTASKVSAHFGIGFNGETHQYVDTNNTAWANGIVKNPSAKFLKPNINPNLYTLSIENEGHDLSTAPQTQLNALTALISSLCDKYAIKPSRDTIIGHFEINSVTRGSCPSANHGIMDVIVGRVLQTNKNNKMIKWIKCYATGSGIVNTYNVANNAVESVGETTGFQNSAEAQAASTNEVLIIWDGKIVGIGAVTE